MNNHTKYCWSVKGKLQRKCLKHESLTQVIGSWKWGQGHLSLINIPKNEKANQISLTYHIFFLRNWPQHNNLTIKSLDHENDVNDTWQDRQMCTTMN